MRNRNRTCTLAGLHQDPRDREIGELKQELAELKREFTHARLRIIAMAPASWEVQSMLRDAIDCQTWKELWAWERRVRETALELAKAQQDDDGRANCPLCGEGIQDGRGYAVPFGLERHIGGMDRTQRCSLLETAFKLGRDHNLEKFRAAEAQDLANAERALLGEARR